MGQRWTPTQGSSWRELERLKGVPIKTALDISGYAGGEWFSGMVCPDRHFEILKIWNDPGWQTSGEIDWKVITFYADHWEQVNDNGIFFGKIAPYVAPSVQKTDPLTVQGNGGPR